MALRQVKDTPTNNFATLNSQHHDLVNEIMRDGNLYYEAGTGTYPNHGDVPICFGNMAAVKGHNWYWECHISSTLSNTRIAGGVGILNSIIGGKGNFGYAGTDYYNGGSYGWTMDGNSSDWNSSWNFSINGSTTTEIQGVPYFKHNDIAGVHLDLVANKVYLYVNGVPFNAGSEAGRNGEYSIINSETWFPVFACGTSGGNHHFRVNFGQNPDFSGQKSGGGNHADANGIGQFYYEPPAGALALCSQNIQSVEQNGSYVQNYTSTKANFRAVTYTGNGGTQDVITGFQPDLVWIKARNTGYAQLWNDSIRGTGVELRGNETAAQTTRPDGFTSFNATGFSVGTNAAYNDPNNGMVAWCWKAGGAPSADDKAMVDGEEKTITGDSKLDAGNVTPTRMSVNTKAGFSIAKYSGNSTSGATIPHGLSGLDFLIVKAIINGSSGDTNWRVYHKSLGATKNLKLNSTAAPETDTSRWNDTEPTSTVFSLGDHPSTNATGYTYIAYCWHSVPGYSKFGSYTGNGSADGPFVYTGFKPAFVMLKNTTTAATNWQLNDIARDPFNVVKHRLAPSTSDKEESNYDFGLFLSNGFRIQQTDQTWNKDGDTYIYVAFAEQPGAFSNAQ